MYLQAVSKWGRWGEEVAAEGKGREGHLEEKKGGGGKGFPGIQLLSYSTFTVLCHAVQAAEHLPA